MDKNLVVSLDEIKGIRLQCLVKECGSAVVVSPANPYLLVHERSCPRGHPWQEPGRQESTINRFLDALRLLLIEEAALLAVRLEIDGGQVEEPDAEGRNE